MAVFTCVCCSIPSLTHTAYPLSSSLSTPDPASCLHGRSLRHPSYHLTSASYTSPASSGLNPCPFVSSDAIQSLLLRTKKRTNHLTSIFQHICTPRQIFFF